MLVHSLVPPGLSELNGASDIKFELGPTPSCHVASQLSCCEVVRTVLPCQFSMSLSLLQGDYSSSRSHLSCLQATEPAASRNLSAQRSQISVLGGCPAAAVTSVAITAMVGVTSLRSMAPSWSAEKTRQKRAPFSNCAPALSESTSHLGFEVLRRNHHVLHH